MREVEAWQSRGVVMGRSRAPLRRTLYLWLEDGQRETVGGQVLSAMVSSLVLLNVAAVILETVPEVGPEARAHLQTMETASLLIFSVEYLLRIYCCVESERYRHPFFGRLRFVSSPLAILDFLAIGPALLGLSGTFDLRAVRLIRLLRLLRVLKLGRYSRAVQTLAVVFMKCRGELGVLTFIALLVTMLSGSAMYSLESEAQPQAFSSIPAGMWWAIATLTTVGYGDIYPITPSGRVVAAIISLIGIGLFALPAGVLGGAFIEELRARRSKDPEHCPRCQARELELAAETRSSAHLPLDTTPSYPEEPGG